MQVADSPFAWRLGIDARRRVSGQIEIGVGRVALRAIVQKVGVAEAKKLVDLFA